MGLFDRLRAQPVLTGDDMFVPRTEVAAQAPPNPRKQTTGTTLSSGGSIPVDRDAEVELGSAAGGLTREIVPALGNRQQQVKIYDEMANNDAAVDVSLRAAKMPIMGADYYVEAFDDKQFNQDIAEFVSFNLFEGTSAPFLLILEDILRMYEYGFSVLEKVYEPREWAPRRTGANRRVYTMIKKLAPRPTPTISKFNYDDNGGPVEAVHGAVRADGRPEEVKIPVNKLVIFTFNKKGGNLEGRPILRTAYKHWYYKDNLYKIDAIQKERHALGVPKARLQAGFTKKDADAARKLVANLRTNEEAGMVLPPNIDVEFAELHGNPVDVIPSIEHHNGMIMLNVMVQFLLLGLTGGGGRATSGSHQDMFTKSLRYVAGLICDIVNLYVIPQLVAYNFATDEFPRVKVRNIGETKDLQQWASAVSNLIAQNAITVDLEFEQWVRKVADAPSKLGNKQTPENNASNQGGGVGKGNINQGTQSGGNSGVPTDQAGT